MKKISIAVAAELRERFYPEISWVMRLLFTSMGYAWREVSIDEPCDIAYVTSESKSYKSKIIIVSNLENWNERNTLCLESIDESGGWPTIKYTQSASKNEVYKENDKTIVIDHDMIFDIFWIGTGQEEPNLKKDKHNHYRLENTNYTKQWFFLSGIVSKIGIRLKQLLVENGFEKPIPLWPEEKKAAVCVSHDVDYPQVVKWIEPLRIIQRQGTGGINAAILTFWGKLHHWHFDSWMKLEKSFNTKSAFFFSARKGSLTEFITSTPDPFYEIETSEFRDLFKAIDEEGFEIGLHASYHAYNSPQKFNYEKEKLERICGHRIAGNRHHYWHMNPVNIEQTLRYHEEAGLIYDTSIAHERYPGWRRGISWPYFPFIQDHRREISTLQIPTAFMDIQLTRYKVHNPGDSMTILKRIVDKTIEHGGCLMIDAHVCYFDKRLFPGHQQLYVELWKYITEKSVFWTGTPQAVAKHWKDRYERILGMSDGLMAGAKPK